jgi:PAS domain S-box-containing protein
LPLNYQPTLENAILFYKEGFSRDMIAKAVENGMKTGQPWNLELPIITAKGREIWVKAQGEVEMENGICKRIYGIFQDIDEQKRAELQLHEAKTRLELLEKFIDVATDAIQVAEESGKFIYLNQVASERLGIPRDKVHEYAVQDIELTFQQPSDWEQHVQELKSVPFVRLEGINLNQKTQQLIAVEVVVRHSVINGVGYIIAVVRDATEQKKQEQAIQQQTQDLLLLNAELKEQKRLAEDALIELREAQNQLVQAEKMASLGLLTAGVAHEINNPINYVFGGVQGLEPVLEDLLYMMTLYERKCLSSDEQERERLWEEIMQLKDDGVEAYAQKLVQSIKDGAQRVASIVQSLRNFSRTDDGTKQKANINENILNTLLILHSKYKNKIEITTELYTQLPEISCYAGQLSQAFMNLIDNAIDAVPIGGRIAISTHLHEQHVEIRISDNGPGIRQEFINKIFDPFFTTKGIGKGTGLGLSIVHGIIKKHEGHIEVSSSSEGTTFIIKLPLE